MKRLAILIVLSIFTGMVLPAGAQAATTYSDTKTHWAKDYIATVANAGYVSGYENGTFKPDNAVTRAEFASVLIRCLGYEPTNGSSSFSDMKSHWAKGYVDKAVALGIIVPEDYGSNFNPNTALKRSEICGMLVRALGKKPDYSSTGFKDSAAINKSVMRGYIKVACDLKLLSGYPNGNFEPFQQVTRAQMCKVVINFMSAQGKSLDVPSSTDTTATTNTTNTTPSTSLLGDFSTLAIGDLEYDLATTPVIFKIDLTNVTATNLTKQQGALFINGQYRFVLDSSVSKLDIVVNNTRYPVTQISASGSRLIIYPGKRKMASVTISTHKYDADFVNLYINSSSKGYYLSDLDIIDSSTVEVNGKKYSLPVNKITLELGTDFYDITGFTLSSSATTPILSKTDSVIARAYKLSDISAIFVGTTTLNLSSIITLQFIIDGEEYILSDLNIDASGKITVEGVTYDSTKVLMLVNSQQYKVNNVSMVDRKLIFYCAAADISGNMVLLDGKYRDASKVTILKDGVAYDLDHVVAISKNVLRISGKQYYLDSSFKVKYDGSTYFIKEFNFNSTLEISVIETSTKVTTSEPVSYNFYVDNTLYQRGATDQTTIYTSNKWVTFGNIIVSDPANFVSSSTNYALIGALVKIGSIQYKVTDTAWHGSSQILDLYLKEL